MFESAEVFEIGQHELFGVSDLLSDRAVEREPAAWTDAKPEDDNTDNEESKADSESTILVLSLVLCGWDCTCYAACGRKAELTERKWETRANAEDATVIASSSAPHTVMSSGRSLPLEIIKGILSDRRLSDNDVQYKEDLLTRVFHFECLCTSTYDLPSIVTFASCSS